MILRDIKGIYLPATYVMIGLSNLIVCNCSAAPSTTNVTGPSGSSMICVFYYIFHLLLWIPVGIFLVVTQWFRYRDSTIITGKPYYQSSSSDNTRHLISSLTGGFLVLVSSVTLADPLGALSIFIASLIVSIVPTVVFFALGTLLTMPKRKRIQEAEQAAT